MKNGIKFLDKLEKFKKAGATLYVTSYYKNVILNEEDNPKWIDFGLFLKFIYFMWNIKTTLSYMVYIFRL